MRSIPRVLVAIASVFVACARGEAGDDIEVRAPKRVWRDSGISEVTDPNVSDAGIVGEDDTTTDAGGADGMAWEKEAGGPNDGGADGATQGLDPGLELPGPGTTCTTPGTSGDCPGLTVCRIATSTMGRCESCTTCGNLNALCNASSECDILFQCYKGKCTNICPLGTSFCGPVADCIDVGHATHGVCKP